MVQVREKNIVLERQQRDSVRVCQILAISVSVGEKEPKQVRNEWDDYKYASLQVPHLDCSCVMVAATEVASCCRP